MNMPLALLNRRRRGAVAFSPTALFALAEPGVWYDPSDLTTLFQDTAGTTPVTTPGQSVALALDKSNGLVLGPELVTNRDFSSGTGWTLDASASISGGQLNFTSSTVTNTAALQNAGLVAGRTYRVQFTVTQVTAGSVTFVLLGSSNNGSSVNATGTYTRTILVNAANANIGFTTSGFTGSIDNVSVKELPGFHATQATAGSRPIYGIVPVGGRRNLLTWTEDFRNTAAAGVTRPWTYTSATVSADTTTAPNGTVTADTLFETATTDNHRVSQASVAATAGSPLTATIRFKQQASGRNLDFVIVGGGSFVSTIFSSADGSVLAQNDVLGSVFSAKVNSSSGPDAYGFYTARISVNTASTTSFTLIAGVANGTSNNYLGDVTKGLFIWGAQLEAGSTATAYQRVVSQYDVTEAGVSSLSYLAFDGVDDSLVTPSVNFSTDKMTVFAGVRKLSDAGLGIVAESSVDVSANNGSFWLVAPRSASATYGWRSKGSTAVVDVVSASSFAAPITNVVTGIGDIAGDVATLRVNGVQTATSSADQGTGNYAANILYIGRRGGSTLPFNGHLYSLIVRNAATNADQLAASEKWVAGKTGVTL